MSRITRCTHCFNPVFEDATVCPHCSVGRTPANRPRILSRGAWIFIISVTLIFAVGDTLVRLRQRKFQALERAVFAAERQQGRFFLNAWLNGILPEGLPLASTASILEDLEVARAMPEVKALIPVDRVVQVRLERTTQKRSESLRSRILPVHGMLELTLNNFAVRVKKDGKWFDITGTLGLHRKGVGSLQVRSVEPVTHADDPFPFLPATVVFTSRSARASNPPSSQR